jgi:hypothetical protein
LCKLHDVKLLALLTFLLLELLLPGYKCHLQNGQSFLTHVIQLSVQHIHVYTHVGSLLRAGAERRGDLFHTFCYLIFFERIHCILVAAGLHVQ